MYTFSLVSTYISWSSLSLPTPRMRKTSHSCMVSAAHPLVTRSSCRLFRFCSFCLWWKKSLSQADLLCTVIGDFRQGGIHPWGEVRCVQRWDSSVSQCHCSKLDMQIALLLDVKINISAYILSQLHNNRRDSGCVSYFKTTCWLQFVLACVCVLIASHRTASVTRVSTKLALPRHWPS